MKDEEGFISIYDGLVANELIQAYDPRVMTNELATVVEAAHQCGATCVLAHPGRGGMYPVYDPSLLDQLLAEIPIDGIEAYYPTHSPEQRESYLAYAQQHGLVVSSGSDSHGLKVSTDQAPIKYPAHLSQQLLARVGIRVQ
ncbi:hypothetical protein [Dictyobacter kobayashii]|uniref:hypothetical protein n=1 Tax=Dictyobacter kobayashii TaxID=2014872 RepID=UPI0013870FF8|nr:hypothetical protein [Dictyobacter kobayashii]